MDLRHKDEIYDPRLANHVDKDKVNFLNDYVYKDLVSIIAIRDCCKKGCKFGFRCPKYILQVGGFQHLCVAIYQRYSKQDISFLNHNFVRFSQSSFIHSAPCSLGG